MRAPFTPAVLSLACALAPATGRAQIVTKQALDRDWTLQSSAHLAAGGAELSRVGYDTSQWYRITVPNTVVGEFVDAASREEILPVFWDFELFPGGTREIAVAYGRTPSEPRVEVEAWNVAR